MKNNYSYNYLKNLAKEEKIKPKERRLKEIIP